MIGNVYIHPSAKVFIINFWEIYLIILCPNFFIFHVIYFMIVFFEYLFLFFSYLWVFLWIIFSFFLIRYIPPLVLVRMCRFVKMLWSAQEFAFRIRLFSYEIISIFFFVFFHLFLLYLNAFSFNLIYFILFFLLYFVFLTSLSSAQHWIEGQVLCPLCDHLWRFIHWKMGSDRRSSKGWRYHSYRTKCRGVTWDSLAKCDCSSTQICDREYGEQNYSLTKLWKRSRSFVRISRKMKENVLKRKKRFCVRVCNSVCVFPVCLSVCLFVLRKCEMSLLGIKRK